MFTPAQHLRLGLIIGSAAMALAARVHAEPFFDFGVNASRIEARIANQGGWITSDSGGVHVGIGVRRTLGNGNDIGVRLELDDVDSNALLAVRAFDYRFNRSERFAIGAFLGAARLDLATPAYGYYFGGGLQFKDLLAGWDLGVDLRRGDKIARDNVLSSDPQGGSPDDFYDLTGLSVYFSKRF